jgi:putative ABC transport system ATP-binding protein
VLTLRSVSKSYGGPRPRRVLAGIDFQLEPGGYVAVMGESGVGKSTLLNLIAGLEPPDSGQVLFNSADLSRLSDDALTRLRRREMGFVFQAFHVLPYLTVRQNVALPLALAGVPETEAMPLVAAMLQSVGLSEHARSMPGELSGGETQRVAIARALVHRPKLILADEPTGNLDHDTALQVLHLLRDQIKDCGASGILVTHSTEAAATADRVYLLTAERLHLRP